MILSNRAGGKERYGTIIAALGIDPEKVTREYLQALEKEFGCTFEKGEAIIWVEASEETAERIFEALRKRYWFFE